MTRSYSISFVLALVFAACAPAPKEPVKEAIQTPKDFSSSRNAIRKVMDDQSNSWNEGSIDGFMKGYWHSDSLQFITKRGIRKGYDSVALNYKKSYSSREKMGILTFSGLEIAPLDPGMAHVTGKWEVRQADTTVSGLFSLVFRQIGPEWKIIIDHTW